MDQRIRFAEPIEFEPPEEMLPAEDLITIDDETERCRADPFQVYIVADIFKEIRRQVGSSLDKETGGLLIGYPFRAMDNPEIIFSIITGAIHQDSPNRSIGHFTVSPKEIAAARTEMEQLYPGLLAVGWYHSHPGHGVFLSGQDMTIVRSIYNAAWHVALVVDPIQKKAAFFRGMEGERLPGWTELEEMPLTVKAMALYNQAKEILAQKQPTEARRRLKQLEQLTGETGLGHWRAKGGYRDIAELLAQIPPEAKEITTEIQEDGPLPESPDSTPPEDKDVLRLARRYQEAKEIFTEAIKFEDPDLNGLNYAKQHFAWIAAVSPGYQETEMYLNAIYQILKHPQERRERNWRENLLARLGL